MITLSDQERDELRDSARRLLTARSSSSAVRNLLDDDVGFDRELWRAIAELGWLAIGIPEADGGLGASFADVGIVVHEMGRQLTGGPMLSSAILGASALAGSTGAGSQSELLGSIASGETLVAVANCSEHGSYEPDQLTMTAATKAGAWTVSGVARFVPDGHVADRLVVGARTDDGHDVIVVVDRSHPGVQVTVEPTIDQTRRLARVELNGVAVPDDDVISSGPPAVALLQQVTARGAIAVMCDAVGAAERLLEMTTEYAKQRHQFDRPIGSFQAVKHHLANVLIDVEASRAGVALAAHAVDSADDLRHAAAIAKSFAGPACARVAALALQVHGGIGFTWEHDTHLLLKRIKLDEALFGTPKWHRQRLAYELVDEHRAI